MNTDPDESGSATLIYSYQKLIGHLYFLIFWEKEFTHNLLYNTNINKHYRYSPKAAKTEATGLYSRKAFERLGFTVAAEFLYADYEVKYWTPLSSQD